MKILFLPIVASTLLFYSAEISYAGSRLSGDEINAVFSGKKYKFTGPYNGTQRFRRNGNTSYTLTDGYKNSGQWFVEGNKICTFFEDRSPQKKCASVRENGNGTYKLREYTYSRN